MIDVQEHGVKALAGGRRIEARAGIGQREEIAVNQSAAWIASELCSEGDETALMPFDDGLERVDHDERAHAGMRERRRRGIPEAEATHHDIPFAGVQRGEPEVRERDFRFVEKARHEESLAKLYFKDLEAFQHEHAPPAQGQFTERGLPVVEFFKVFGHTTQFLTACIIAYHRLVPKSRRFFRERGMEDKYFILPSQPHFRLFAAALVRAVIDESSTGRGLLL